jgi:hypothetical protein
MMKLGTREARFYYHAGMIAQARGDLVTAEQYLREALAINPHFDVQQAGLAQEILSNLVAQRKS